MRWLLCFLVGCAVDPSPPFTYELQQRPNGVSQTLLHLEFESYAAALLTGPYTVMLMDGGGSKEVSMTPGFCRQFACTGPLAFESLMLTVDDSKGNVLGYSCVGTDGTMGAGVDLTQYGDCAH